MNRSFASIVPATLAAIAALIAAATAQAGADPVAVGTESELRAAWSNPRVTAIELTDDIFLRACRTGEPIRESALPMTVDGNGHTLRQTCFEKRLLRQDGTGFLLIEDIALTRGGNDGPGAAVTTRGEIELRDSRVTENLAEEPGGGIFSMRRATIVRSVLTGNLANDDGGAVYARRGGVEVFDSIVSANLVDGSGGAIGSTGDILVVNSHVDGNTTDGDGGALYADEDGDVTVINSTVDGNTADGPGGAIFTLDGDVTIVNSTLNANRADDRGGAISGEADVTVIGSTIARNAAVAHVGGGVWSRSDTYVTNSTIADNYAEGEGGGILAAGDLGLVYSTVLDNIGPVAANIGVGDQFTTFGSIIGPARIGPVGGQVQPTGSNCHVSTAVSSGYNFVSDHSCALDGPGDVVDAPAPMLDPLGENGGIGESRVPAMGSPVLDQIPAELCSFTPFGYSLEGEQHLARFAIDPLARVAADQRSIARPQGANCDVGAVERGATSGGAAGPSLKLSVPKVAKLPPSLRGGVAGSEGPLRSMRVGKATQRSTLGRLRARIEAIGRALAPMERSAKRFRQWMTCISWVPVSEHGDPDHSFGFAYDEKDGAGLDARPALAVSSRGRPDYTFLKFAKREGCESATTVPGGTADNAKRPVSDRGDLATLSDLEGRLDALEQRADDVERAAERFDEWESCLSWVPVTEYGDPDRRYGYLYGDGKGELGYRPALAIDISEWDDPDYEFLAFIGRDRPFVRRECGHEPGEGVDKAAPSLGPESGPAKRIDSGTARRERLRDLRQDLASFQEDVEDLAEPTEEFELFDQCMFTIGVSQYGADGAEGYRFGPRSRPALAMDMRGFDPARYDFMAFPGEEPPQIECNEDAGGQGTDE
jgi:hypothetical protein